MEPTSDQRAKLAHTADCNERVLPIAPDGHIYVKGHDGEWWALLPVGWWDRLRFTVPQRLADATSAIAQVGGLNL